MKKILSMLIVLAMILCLAPLALADDDFDPSEITLTWASPIINHPVIRICELGFVEACEELGYQHQVVGPETVDFNEANAAAEAAAAAGSPGVLLWIGDEVAINGASILKNDYGCFVGSPHQRWDKESAPGVDFCMALDYETVGRAVADWMAERLEGQTGSIALTMGAYAADSNAESAAFIARIEEIQAEGKLEGITVLEPAIEGAEDITESTNVNASIIQANPDLIAAWSLTGNGPITWSNAARKCGLEPDDLLVVSMDYTSENLATLETGYCDAIVAQPLYEEAYKCTYALDALLRGEEVEYWTELDAPLVYPGGEDIHDPAFYADILSRIEAALD